MSESISKEHIKLGKTWNNGKGLFHWGAESQGVLNVSSLSQGFSPWILLLFHSFQFHLFCWKGVYIYNVPCFRDSTKPLSPATAPHWPFAFSLRKKPGPHKAADKAQSNFAVMHCTIAQYTYSIMNSPFTGKYEVSCNESHRRTIIHLPWMAFYKWFGSLQLVQIEHDLACSGAESSATKALLQMSSGSGSS